MRPIARRWFFFLSATVLFLFLLWGFRDLAPFGQYRGPYGIVLNQITVYERHVTDVVTAVNFDFRGLDTLGEESILFMSVVGATLLLRKQKEEMEEEEKAEAREDESRKRRVPNPSDATRTLTLALVGPLVVFGVYVITHGQLTPGGGFQGGVVLATAPLMVYIAGDFHTFKRITNQALLEGAEGFAIFGYAMVGLLGLIAGGAFLQNVLPRGATGEVLSGGTIPLLNLATGLAVAAGFVQLLYAFLEQTLEIRLGGD